MDFNPDEAIAAGWIRAGSQAARMLERFSRFSLRRADRVIVLDRFMRQRIEAKGIAPDKILVLPLWSQDEHVRFNPAGREQFRQAHGLNGKFVIMYSGNHSPCHPLDTLMAAATRLANQKDICFCFVGGGTEWRRLAQGAGGDVQGAGRDAQGAGRDVQGAGRSAQSAERRAQRAERTAQRAQRLWLPYQPLSDLSSSLSAADLHVVIMGEPFVGLVHPCKIYNLLNIGAPILYIGPAPSHVTEIFDGAQGPERSAQGAERSAGSEYQDTQHARTDRFPSFAAVRHGDVEQVVSIILTERARFHQGNRGALPTNVSAFAREKILPQLVAAMETSDQPRAPRATRPAPRPAFRP
jgi:hypothetical protein